MGAPGTMVAAGGAAGRGVGRAGMLGTNPVPACAGAAGRDGTGGASCAIRASGEVPGNGWRGPERI